MTARPLAIAYRPYGLGDTLVIVPALRGLRRLLPGHELLLLTPAEWTPLAMLSGAIDGVVPVERHYVGSEPFTEVELGSLDVAVNLQGRGPRGHRHLLAMRPRSLVAFRCAEVGNDGPEWRWDEHEVAKWCRLVNAFGAGADPSDLDLPAPPPTPFAGAVVVHPGAGAAARLWPLDRWAAVIRHVTAAGLPVVITGSRGERALVAGLAERAAVGPPLVRCREPRDVLELAAVVAHARAVVCADTGVAHLATAFRTPSVVLFGPSSPARWGPPADRPWHRAIWHGVEGDAFAASLDPGLDRITTPEVLAELDALLTAHVRNSGHERTEPKSPSRS